MQDSAQVSMDLMLSETEEHAKKTKVHANSPNWPTFRAP
jgi:hypothetical protein